MRSSGILARKAGRHAHRFGMHPASPVPPGRRGDRHSSICRDYPRGLFRSGRRNQQLTATGTFSDGTTQDVTINAHWSSNGSDRRHHRNAPVRAGLATTFASGTTTIGVNRGASRYHESLGELNQHPVPRGQSASVAFLSGRACWLRALQRLDRASPPVIPSALRRNNVVSRTLRINCGDAVVS